MKDFILQIANGAGQNLINLTGTTIGLYLVKFLVVLVVKGYKALLKNKVTKLVIKYIPNGIAFGDILKGTKPNEEVLFQAVLTVENLVLKAFPAVLRPTIDKMIDGKAIARDIERALNEDKTEGLAKAPVE